MANISDLIGLCDDSESEEYKQGWQDAVCYINDRHKIVDRNTNEAMDFVFELKINEEQVADAVFNQMRGM